jgi:hypothetical protein
MSSLSRQFTFVIGTGTNTSTSVLIPSAAIAPDGSSLFKSIKEKANGYYGLEDGIHTVSYTITPNFLGTITTQATLATDPVESDWFTINGTTFEFDNLINPALTTTTNYANFIGNFVWVRSVVHRSDEPTNGSVLFINYNH